MAGERWTVGELKERLDDYGDHLLVSLVIEENGRSKRYDDFDLSDTSADTSSGGMEVDLRVWEV